MLAYICILENVIFMLYFLILANEITQCNYLLRPGKHIKAMNLDPQTTLKLSVLGQNP